MKATGVSENDPEFIKIRGVLDTVTRQRNLQRQRETFRRQQEMQQQQQLQGNINGNGLLHGTNNGFQSSNTSTMDISQPTATPSMPLANDTTSASEAHTQRGLPSAYTLLSEEQRLLLQNQVQAFKLLSKNAPLPQAVQQAIFLSQQMQQTFTTKEVFDVAAHPQDSNLPSFSREHSGNEKENGMSGNTETGYESFISPYSHLEKLISYNTYAQRDKRPLIPSIMPTGVDVDRLRDERENIIYNRLLSRKAELEKVPANIDSWDTSKSDIPLPDGSLKLKALIEYKMLCLLPKQRALRQQISREMVQADTLAMTANRAMYRRQKKQSLREARITEKLEKQQRDARESKEKKKHVDYLRAILDHAEEVHKSAREQRARVQKLGRMMIAQHQTIEKEEQKRVERTAKQRLQALKANDEETYLKLLGQAKDSRISHLLKQTDGFLKQLAASVKSQQRSSVNAWGNKNAPVEEVEDEEEDDEEGGKKIDYYEVAHRNKEEVKAQSSNLVGGTLKEYQVKGLQWMLSLYNNNLNGILADEMGLGKTIQTISLITYLIEKKRQPGPFLVIVPLSTLTNWTSEFEKWAPSVVKIVYKGPPNQRKQASGQIRMGQFQVLLTTYEFIIKDRPILSKVKWLHMIVDEGHRMKNAGSKLSSTITQYYQTKFRLILTGTPLQNNLPELWALLNFVLPTIFKSVKSFDEWFNTPFANTGTQDKMDLTEEEQLLVIRRLHKVLRPFLLRRLKKDVEKDLPDKQERVIKCNFSSLQAKLYKQLVTHNKLMVSDGKGGKTGLRGLSNMLMQLRKLCNHPFVFEEVEDQINPQKTSNDLLWRTSGKFELLDRVLPKFQATGHRVLMFFQMTQIMNIMEDFMRLRGISYLRLDGSTKADERSELLRLFNAPNSPYFCFLLSTRAGGLGLNLQTADTVIIYDSDWNPHQDLQAQDRAHRIGQKNEVRILRLISSNSVEEKILERAQYKLDMDGKVIQAGKFDNKSTNEERDAMLRVMLESAEAAENLEQDEMDDDDLNMLMMRSDDELIVFQKLDAERARDKLYGPGPNRLPRLFCDEELPDIYMQEDNPVVEEIEEHTGRGARERTKIKYDDGLTEEQWLDAVDNDEDSIEAAIARKNAKVARRAVTKDKQLRDTDSQLDDNSPPPDIASSESPAPAPIATPATGSRKRGRKPTAKATVDKRKVDDMLLDDSASAAPSTRKRGRATKASETLQPRERTALQKSLDAVYESLMDLEEPASAADIAAGYGLPRPLIDPFIELPSKAQYPDYYKLIREPVCMEDIKKRINRRIYQNLNGFWTDIQLLTANCKQFNEDGSVLYRDAGVIEVCCHLRLTTTKHSHDD